MSRALASLALLVLGLVLGAAGAHRFGRAPEAEPTVSPARPSAPASRDLDGRPNDPAAWLALAERLEERGEPRAAEAAIRGALSLAPESGAAHARLGYLLYELGRDREAAAALAEARAHGGDPNLDFALNLMKSHVDLAGPFPRFLAQAPSAPATPPASSPPEDEPEPADPEGPATLEEPPEPADPSGPATEQAPTTPEVLEEPAGECSLPLDRAREDGGTFLAAVTVDGTEATLIYDTGATLTVLSRDLVERIGARLDQRRITARTASGVTRFDLAIVDEIDVGGRVVRDLRVAVCDECVSERSEGLLGLDVQQPLNLSLDVAGSRVRFGDCAE